MPSFALGEAGEPNGKLDGLCDGSKPNVGQLAEIKSEIKSFRATVQKSIDDLRQSQAERDKSLRNFIQQELKQLSMSETGQATVNADGTLENTWQKQITPLDPTPTSNTGSNDCPNDTDASLPRARTASEIHASELWTDFQAAVNNSDDKQLVLFKTLQKKMKKTSKSILHEAADALGLSHCVAEQIPNTRMARMTNTATFTIIQTTLIVSNIAIMAYEIDASVQGVLKTPKEEAPKWLDTVDLAFNATFAAELVFRVVALRTWFLVSPADWGWNMFDTAVVVSSLLSDLLSGLNFSFIRTFRLLRAVRALRVIRVLRFFRELRKILFAILACLGSLAWSFAFLLMTMFMISILLLQGIVHALNDMEPGTPEYEEARANTKLWYGSMADSMFSLLAGFTGGTDWLEIHKPVVAAGGLYTTAFVLYILFVIVGVMNVLTGVFLASADDFTDRDLVVQDHQIKVEAFVEHVLEVFQELDLNKEGNIDWPTFKNAMNDDMVQAYLSAHGLEPSQARLIFDLLDEKGSGRVDLLDFVMGMLRLKGEAKSVDVRVVQREIGMIPLMLRGGIGKKPTQP